MKGIAMANSTLCPHCCTEWKTKMDFNEQMECTGCLEVFVVRPFWGDQTSLLRKLDFFSFFKGHKCANCNNRNTNKIGEYVGKAEFIAGEMRRPGANYYFCKDCKISWKELYSDRA